MKIKISKDFSITIYIIVFAYAFVTIYPFLNIAAVSVSSYSSYLENPMRLFPGKLDFRAYAQVLKNPILLSSYKNTILITIVGTLFSLLLTVMTSYPLSRKNFKASPFFVYVIIITMLFSGGLIPKFYLIRSLGLYDTLWALILPNSISAFNIILMVNFMRSIPASLIEAAKIDGASEIYVLVKIILPLSMAILATLGVFYAVGRWNTFFNAIIYIRDRNKWTLQLLLREVLWQSESVLNNNSEPGVTEFIPTQNIRYATILISVLPILAVYPFAQKYFIKGVMVGSIKG